MPDRSASSTRRGAATLVAAGILLSRLAGLVRERVLAHYFGTSLYADVFRAALRMPNVLQNLLGEGTLSASFIPVYAELLEQKKHEEAGRVAGAILALLLTIVCGLALLGVLGAPLLVAVFLPGFEGERRELAVACTRIIFPMTGLLVLSAWTLGILNSHRRFFVPYVAPVLWNAAMIAALILFGGALANRDLVVTLAWGAFIGGAAQLLVQLPWVLYLQRGIKIRWALRMPAVREAVRNAGPAILGRGVVQVGSYLDMFLASLLATGAVATLGYAQTLYILPVSLFGMSVAAAELPELARQRSEDTEKLRLRVRAGLRRIALLVVPSFFGFLALGDIIVAALYQTGDFGHDDTALVHLVLAAYSVGLVASTTTRLYSSAFFALRDTKTPARVALIRVLVAGAIAGAVMFPLDGYTAWGKPLGPVGLGLGAGLAAWLEWTLLRRALRGKIGAFGVGAKGMAKIVVAAAIAAAAGRGLAEVLPPLHPILVAAATVGLFGVVYFAVARLLGIEEATAYLRKVAARVRRKKAPTDGQ